MPTRAILSAYVGPMPRPVVPSLRLPRKRSVTLSSVRLYGVMTCAAALTTSRDVSTPRALSPSISSNSTPRSTTTPLPMIGVQPGVRMPDGRRCNAYFSDPTTIVWPALLPPLNLTTASTRLPSRSVALPLPSSPHWAPSRTIAGMTHLSSRPTLDDRTSTAGRERR